MQSRMRNSVLAVAAVMMAISAAAQGAALVGPIDFDSQTEFDNTFTALSGGIGWNSADDAGFGLGGYVSAARTTNIHDSMVYNTDSAPGGASDVFSASGGFVIDMDARIAVAARAVGIYFLGTSATNRDSKHWAMLQLNRTDNNMDRGTFWTGRDMDSNSGGTNSSGSIDQNTSLTLNQWFHLRLTVQLVNSDTQVQVSLKGYDSQTLFDATTLKYDSGTYTFTVGDSLTAASEIGASTFSSDSLEVGIDNFAVYALGQEPTSLALIPTPAALPAGLALMTTLALRRRG